MQRGQICININQVAVAEEIADSFNEALKAEFIRQIGEKPEENEEYPRLITDSAYDKCRKLAEQYKDRIIFGGTGHRETRRFAPTIIYPVGIDEDIVQQELFCPLLRSCLLRIEEVDYSDGDQLRTGNIRLPCTFHQRHEWAKGGDFHAAVRAGSSMGLHPYDVKGCRNGVVTRWARTTGMGLQGSHTRPRF